MRYLDNQGDPVSSRIDLLILGDTDEPGVVAVAVLNVFFEHFHAVIFPAGC